jgi:hypothetical protein
MAVTHARLKKLCLLLLFSPNPLVFSDVMITITTIIIVFMQLNPVETEAADAPRKWGSKSVVYFRRINHLNYTTKSHYAIFKKIFSTDLYSKYSRLH